MDHFEMAAFSDYLLVLSSLRQMYSSRQWTWGTEKPEVIHTSVPAEG